MKRELGIARCGLACCLCSENVNCHGCNSGECPDKAWCENRKCSLEQGYGHCYDCGRECRKGLLAKIKPYGFTRLVNAFGKKVLRNVLKRKRQPAVVYNGEGFGGNTNDFTDVEELIRFIREGRR